MPIGKSYVLTSGLNLTNNYQGFNFSAIRFGTVSIGFDVLRGESGVSWRVQGQQIVGGPVHLIGSGELLVSGVYTILTSGFDYYEQLVIGAKARQDDHSGVVSIIVLGKVD